MLTPGQLARLVDEARAMAGGGPLGDCEFASGFLASRLTGGSRRYGPLGRSHAWYVFHDVVIDVTAGQFITELNSVAGCLSAAEVEQAGLMRAVESGLFTQQEHDLLMQMLPGPR